MVNPTQARIVVGISSVNVAFLPLYVTIDKNFFKDEALDILPVMFNSGNTYRDSFRSVEMAEKGIVILAQEELDTGQIEKSAWKKCWIDRS